MNRKLRIGIVGFGFPGRMHAKALIGNPDAELYAAADLSPERRAAYQEEFNPPRMYSDIDELLADPDVDAVVLSLPNFLHYPASLAVLESGRHVLCEKPPTMNAAEMRLLKAEAEKRGLIYFFGRQMRFSAEMIAAQQVVSSGSLGRIFRAEACWIRSRGIPKGIDAWFTDKRRAGGGVLIDLGVHALDAAWFLMNHPRPVAVSSKVFQNFAHFVPNLAVNDVDDCAFAFIRLENGSIIDLAVSWAGHNPEDPVEAGASSNGFINTTLHGTEGTLRLNPAETITDLDGGVVSTPLELGENLQFERQMQNFVDAILDRCAPTNSAAQALYLMEMLDAIYESSALNREVVIRSS